MLESDDEARGVSEVDRYLSVCSGHMFCPANDLFSRIVDVPPARCCVIDRLFLHHLRVGVGLDCVRDLDLCACRFVEDATDAGVLLEPIVDLGPLEGDRRQGICSELGQVFRVGGLARYQRRCNHGKSCNRSNASRRCATI